MKIVNRLVAAVLVLLLVAFRPFPTEALDQKFPPLQVPQLKFERYKLLNGMEVILSEDHRLPIVSVNLWYHVGAVNETARRTGFAHLFEHMMFEGSRHVPGNSHFRFLEAAGASDINGTTEFDRTNYYETIPANQLELALWLESDRMGYLPDNLDRANLSNQQDVVRNERRESYENAPYGIAREAVFHLLFPKDHPYYPMVIGSHADIQAAKLEDVRNFFKLYYAPDNASLAIVGDFEPAKVRQLVEKYFGPLKRGPNVPRVEVTTPPITSERRAVVPDNIQLPRVYMDWLTSPIFKPGDADADLAATILGGGKSSRLYKKLVYEKQIALDVEASQQPQVLTSIFQIAATARPGVKPEDLEKIINEELATFRSSGPTPEELRRARNDVETSAIAGLEYTNGVANLLNEYTHYLGNATIESVRSFAQVQLNPEHRVVVYAVPGTPDLGPQVPTPKAEEKGTTKVGGEPVNADAAWRQDPPAPGPQPPMRLPVPEQFTLSNGLTVLYNERPGLPLVAASLVLHAGSGANPVDHPGLASFTSRMLQQGTESRSALQIADRAADLGISLGSRTSTDASSVSFQSLTRSFPDALELLADVALHPGFPQQEIDRVRSERLAALVQEKNQPFALATRVYVAALYGPKNTYGYPDIGTADSIKAMTRDELVNFWQQNYSPNDAALVIAGNIKLADLNPLLEKQFGAWKPGTYSPPPLAAPDPSDAKLIIVDRPNAQQTTLVFCSLGPKRSTPDYPRIEVMNSVLGGLFSSRINMNLREQHGYTYGAGSFFNYHRGPGPFIVYSDVRTDATAPATVEILKELSRMRDTPLSPAELKMAKDSLAQSMPGRFESGEEAAGTIAQIYVYDLSPQYFSLLPAQINAVTAEQARAAAQQYIQPEKMTVLAVGDKAKIEPDLKKLDLGKIEVRDTAGKIVP